ncbi:hypothetical protein D791_03161 [Nitrincola nitratireducens]|uniref:Uncharacterized protein n=3 Tax=Nitrincola TaxID=267849 RepID=W9URK6_9GAMM|nr:hypothetical protein D791_03161 [Nitrincola nitratireducens]
MPLAGMKPLLKTLGGLNTNLMDAFFSDHEQAVLILGALLGIAYGAVGQWSRFCLYRGIEQRFTKTDTGKLHSFALAMACALLLSQVLVELTGIQFSQTHYFQSNPSIPLLILGGVMFGIGMQLANACGARSLVLLGSGNLRSLLVLLCIGLSAYMVMSGVFANLRIGLENLTRISLPSASVPDALARTGLSSSVSRWSATLIIAAGLLMYASRSETLRATPSNWLGAVIIGILISAGWWITGVVGADDFDPIRLSSLTFVAPIGESLQYLMLASGMNLSFASVVVLGVILGSFGRALLSREFQWQAYDSVGQMQKGIVGGVLMGTGGVLSLGCTLGQGLSGFSTLAFTSLIALPSIIFGAYISLRVFKSY